RAGPGDVGEVEDGGFRQALSHVGGGQIEVVVLKHDVGSGAAAGCLDNGLGEGLVDADVAVVPGLVDRTADVRGTGGVPHEMLQEPEQRVGEGVIEALVDGARHLHEVDVDLRIRQLHGAPGELRGAPVAFRHGGGDPGDGDEAAGCQKRRHHATAAAVGDQFAVRIEAVFDRAAVAGD